MRIIGAISGAIGRISIEVSEKFNQTPNQTPSCNCWAKYYLAAKFEDEHWKQNAGFW